MRKLLAALVFLSLFAGGMAFPVRAQQSGLASVSVEIWPEYDRPAVLVIYRLVLPAGNPLPATLVLRVPAAAEVYAVAVNDPDNGLLNAPYDRTVQGKWAELTITATQLDIQVEYYDVLKRDGNIRHVLYEWAGDYAVDQFAVTLQEPTGAADLVIAPELPKKVIGADGFTYFQSTPQSLAAGQSFTLTADYTKTADTLSISGFPVEPGQPLESDIPGQTTFSGVLPTILAGIGGALIVLAVVVGLSIWRRGSRRPAGRRRHPVQARAEAGAETVCPECGKRAQPGDVFCRTCGTRLNKE